MTRTQIATPHDLLDLVGTQLGVTDWLQISQERVNQFAEATDDRQWIHVDPVRAAAGPFGAPIAHGYLTLSLATALIADVLVVEQLNEIVNYGLNRVRFPSPVLVGSRLRGIITLAGANERPAGIEAVFTVLYELEHSDRPACVADVVALYR